MDAIAMLSAGDSGPRTTGTDVRRQRAFIFFEESAMTFDFSAEGHVIEPSDLLEKGLSPFEGRARPSL
jgi:hypothetical protein